MSFLLIVNWHLWAWLTNICVGQSLACSFTYVSITEVNKSVQAEQNFVELQSAIIAVVLPTLPFAQNCPSERAHQLCSSRHSPSGCHVEGGIPLWSWTTAKLWFSVLWPALWKSCRAGCSQVCSSASRRPYLLSGFKPKQHKSVSS